MDQDHHSVLAGEVVRSVLPGADTPDGHRIDELQVAGIEAQRQVDITAVGGPVVGGMTEVVLDIATADVEFGVEIGKLAKDPLRTLPHHIG